MIVTGITEEYEALNVVNDFVNFHPLLGYFT